MMGVTVPRDERKVSGVAGVSGLLRREVSNRDDRCDVNEPHQCLSDGSTKLLLMVPEIPQSLPPLRPSGPRLLRRLLVSGALTIWVPVLLLLIERGIPWLQLVAYLLLVAGIAFGLEGRELARSTARVALVPVAMTLDQDGLRLGVRNLGRGHARRCDISAWLIPDTGAGLPPLPPGESTPPHYSIRLFTVGGSEETQPETLRAERQRDFVPGARYHLRWRTIATDIHDRRSSLEGWAAIEAG